MPGASGVEDHLALRYSIDRLGVDNVMWAIDHPYQPTPPAVAFIDTAPLSEAEKEKVAHANAARYLLPHVLCLSTSSPFWMGRNTGLKSYRSVVFRNFPRNGIPRVFSGYADYAQFVETLVRTRCIPDASRDRASVNTAS